MLSHHRLLWAELLLQLPSVATASTPLLQLRLPNLRAATQVHKDKFIQRVDAAVAEHQRELSALVEPGTTDALEQLTAALTALLHAKAAVSFPVTGAAPRQSVCVIQLQQQRRALSRVIKLSATVLASAGHRGAATTSHCLVQNTEWRQLAQRCIKHHPSLQWKAHACHPCAWISETRTLLNRTRSAIRTELKRMQRAQARPLSECSAAHVHRMLKSDALPSHLQSVVNTQGQLTSSAEELESVMVEHFSSVFAMPAADPTPLPHPPPAMLFVKSSVMPEWYDGLMASVGPDELCHALADTKFVSSPGEDGVSTGLWKLALTGSTALRDLVLQLFSGCLSLSFFPSAWKTSVIVPLVKDDKKERTMSNVRPISLQSCLGKLFMKVMAHRLGGMFARHPILNPAQRGFIHGGSIAKCIDELLDAWEHGRERKSEMYTLFYDIAQAYDSVQRDVLLRAMQRLRMPDSFVELVSDSLTGLTSCIRTAYKVTRRFDVQRSLRQGCPLAPLLFVVLMDALHDGLECNPFTGEKAGLVLKLGQNARHQQMASLGYADDTNILADSLANLRILNDWMHYFLRFNALRLNHSKCELVGRGPDGMPVTAAAVAAAGITIEGHAITPVEHCSPIRYLGVHCRFDGDWSAQHAKSTAMIQLFVRAVSKFRLSVQQAAYMFSVFLLPKLELGLRYITGPQANAWVRGYDAALVGSIKHVIASPLSLSHSAVALTAGFTLPSTLEVAVKVSELFIRLNTTDAHDRWGCLGRQFMLRHVGTTSAKRNELQKERDAGSRYHRAAAHAVNHLQWKMLLREEAADARHRATASRHNHLFAQQPIGTMLLSSEECSSMQAVELTAGSTSMAHDCWTGWGRGAVPREVQVYTDGSFDAHTKPHPTSAWAVTIGDRWLDDNFARVPTDEQLLTAAEVGGATMIGASIAATRGVYPAELQAIARALAAFPLACSLRIHSDSQASIAGIRAYSQQLNSRQRLRMAARPLLQLVHHQIGQRNAAGASVQLEHVRAHSTSADIHSVGNRLSDYRANTARKRPQSATPSTLRELPLAECEHHLTVWMEDGQGQQVIDDVRRTAIAQLKARQLSSWHDKPTADAMDGTFACAALLDTSRVVLATGTAVQQATLIHIATSSIQCCWQLQLDGTRKVLPLQCHACGSALTLLHLSACAAHAAFRDGQRHAMLAVLSTEACATAWLSAHGHLPIDQLLTRLFPPATSTSAHVHITRTMCGVFSTSQANAACKQLGITRAADARRLMQQLRLCCMDGVHAFYTALKLAHL